MCPVSWSQLSRSYNQVRTPGCCLLMLAPQGPTAEPNWGSGGHFVHKHLRHLLYGNLRVSGHSKAYGTTP